MSKCYLSANEKILLCIPFPFYKSFRNSVLNMEGQYEINYDEIIVEDDGISKYGSDKENLEVQSGRAPPTTVRQMELLKASVPATTLSAKEKSDAWKTLTIRLNEIGPPTHDWLNWRNLWYQRKSRSKVSEGGEKQKL